MAQPVKMQAAALARGDDVGCRPRAFRFRDIDVAIGAERVRYAVDGVDRFRGPALEIPAGDDDAQPFRAAVQKRRNRLRSAIGANRIVRVVTLHGIVG